MSKTKSKEVLAKEILANCIKPWFEKGKPPEILHGIGELNNELSLVYGNHSTKGYGSFLCHYLPLKAIEKILMECERMYDEVKFRSDDGSLSSLADQGQDFREKIIKEIAEFATQVFIWGMRAELIEAIEDHLDDALFMAEAAMVNDLGEARVGSHHFLHHINARAIVDEVVTRAATKKRKHIVGLLGAFPKIIAEKKRGRLPGSSKPESLRVQERNEYITKIAGAYQELRVADGRIPTKTSVAKKLGVGGLNPKTGIDSSLTAFNNKLKRLGIDYKAIVGIVEAELNK